MKSDPDETVTFTGDAATVVPLRCVTVRVEPTAVADIAGSVTPVR